MKNLKKLCSSLYFLPAVINTLIIAWIFVWPWLDQPGRIHIPWQMLLVLLIFWGSGILLCKGKWYGGLPAAAIPMVVWLQSQSGYAGMSHISWLPIAAVTVLWSVLCGILAYRFQRK